MRAGPPLTTEWRQRFLAFVAEESHRTIDEVRQWRADAGLADEGAHAWLRALCGEGELVRRNDGLGGFVWAVPDRRKWAPPAPTPYLDAYLAAIRAGAPITVGGVLVSE
jgi:hypothetical protein